MDISKIIDIINASVSTKSNYSSELLTYTFETKESQRRNQERGLYLPCLSLTINIRDKIAHAFLDTEETEGIFEYRDMEYHRIMDCLGNNNL